MHPSRRRTLHESAKPRSELALFLRFLRRRIDPEVRALGPYVRLPQRLRKRVTQEELAEAIGVSREWYSLLESGETTQPSTSLVERLADALMVTLEERARLFHLAVPEAWRMHLRDDSAAVLEAFSRLRSLTKPLWAATSVDDILTAASEQIATWFHGAVLVHTSHRRRSGLWEARALDDKQDRNDPSNCIRDAWNFSSEEIDSLHLYPRLANAGDVGTPEFHPLPLQRRILKLYEIRRLPGFPFLKARVRSRTGLIGGFCIVHESGHSYSASDRAVLGAFAEFASIALS